MSVDYPSWFTANWPLLSGEEPTHEHWEDLRKFLYVAFYPYAGSYEYTTVVNHDLTSWIDLYYGYPTQRPDYNDLVYDSGWLVGFYGELYVLEVRDQTMTPAWMDYNPPTTENDDTGNGNDIVLHADAVLNGSWELAAHCNYYRHFDIDSDRWIVKLNRGTGGGQHAYDCNLLAYRWLPQQTLPEKFPPKGLEPKKAHINQVNCTLWPRDRSIYLKHFTECTLDGPEPFDVEVTEGEQDHYNPLMSDEDGLTAYQDYARNIIDMTGGHYLTNITDDDVWKDYWRLAQGSVWNGDSKDKVVGQIVYKANDAAIKRTSACTKYVCVVAHTTSSATEPPDSDETNYGADWETVWLADCYQPTRIPSQPIWVGWQDDYLACNASGFEKILKDIQNYDWYWCSTADGLHPAAPDWQTIAWADLVSPSPPAAIGCWRRIWKTTLGRPRDNAGAYLEDWKIWPGSSTPPGADVPQLLVTQATYTAWDTVTGGDSYQYAVAPTEDEIRQAFAELAGYDTLYTSLQAENTNQDPETAASYWSDETVALYDDGHTYADGSRIFTLDADTVHFYTSLADSNTGNDPATSPTKWVHDKVKIYDPATTYAEDDLVYVLADDVRLCRKRHNPSQVIAVWDLDADPDPAYVALEQFEVKSETVQDIWDALSRLEFFDGEDVLTVTVGRRWQGDEYVSDEFDNAAEAVDECTVLVEADSYQTSVETDYFPCGYMVGVSNGIGTSIWNTHGGDFEPVGFDEDIFRQTFYVSVARDTYGTLAIGEANLLMRLSYKGVEYAESTRNAEEFSACEIGTGDTSITANPVDTDSATAIVYNGYMQLSVPSGAAVTFYTAPIIGSWPTDLAYLDNFVGSGAATSEFHFRATMVKPSDDGQNYYLIARMDWNKYDALDVFDTPPDPLLT